MKHELINHVDGLDMESIRRVLECAERNQIPNGTYSDMECNLWSMVTASFAKANNRKGVIERISDIYFVDEDGMFYNGESAVHKFERDWNRTCVGIADLYDYYKDWRYESGMTYEMLLANGQKILAIKLYKKRNDCGIREAKMYIDRMV